MGFFMTSNLRQPPPPHRRSLMAANEKEKERNTGQTASYLRRKSLILNMESSSLPDDAWFEILAHLPAQDVYDLARLVCWKWYRMIYKNVFIYANLQYTPYGLLFRCQGSKAFFMTLQQGRIQISMLSYIFSSPFWTTCNGLTVEMGLCWKVFYIINPLTKQVFALPPITPPRQTSLNYGIGYASVSMVYKVVSTSANSKDPCAIITPGVDSSWRSVRTDHPHFLAWFLLCTPLITEGFMHWTFSGNPSQRKVGNQVFTLDLETEILTKSCVPFNYGGYDHWTYLSTGRYLTVLITCGECLWEVWEMKPGNGGGEWRKMDGVIIDLGTQMFEQFGFELIPVGWLKYLEVLVLRVICHSRDYSRVEHYIFLYNLVTKETNLFVLPRAPFVNPVIHKNSLVWLAGC